jgi:hypothetical protein
MGIIAILRPTKIVTFVLSNEMPCVPLGVFELPLPLQEANNTADTNNAAIKTRFNLDVFRENIITNGL